MANSYDYEFNNTFPEQTIGPEFPPMQDFGKKGKKAYDFKKMLLALTTAAAAAVIALSPLGFGVEDVEPYSAVFVYEYEVKNDPQDEVDLTYRLYDGQVFVEDGPMEQGSNEIPLDGLEPDTLYFIRVFQGEKQIKTIRFRTPPVKPIELLPETQPGGFGPGIGGGLDEPEETEAVKPTESPEPTPSPSPSPSPSPTPAPTPSPTPQPTPTPAPYVPEPAPATPKPIPATPAPTPVPTTPPGYYVPGGTPTTDPQAIMYDLNLNVHGSGSDYTISIWPNFNYNNYTINSIGMTLRHGSTVYSSQVFTEIDGGPYSIGYGSTGNYTLEVAIYFTEDATGRTDSFLVTEPVTVAPAKPWADVGYLYQDDGSIYFDVYVDEMDYAGQVTNFHAEYNDTNGTFASNQILADTNSDVLSIEGTIPAAVLDTMSGTGIMYFYIYYNDGGSLSLVQDEIAFALATWG